MGERPYWLRSRVGRCVGFAILPRSNYSNNVYFFFADEYETFTTPVAAATTFLLSLATNRTKSTFLPILGFINSILRVHGPPEQRFGALNMTAALGRQIMKHPEVKNNMEQFMLQFVSPELESPEPFLRAIVNYLLRTLCDLFWPSYTFFVGSGDFGHSDETRPRMVFWGNP